MVKKIKKFSFDDPIVKQFIPHILEEKKEKNKPKDIEFTHSLEGEEGWVEAVDMALDGYEKIVYFCNKYKIMGKFGCL